MKSFKQYILENNPYQELYRKTHGLPKTPKKLFTIFRNGKALTEVYAYSPAQAIRFFKRRHVDFLHSDLEAKEYVRPVEKPVIKPVEQKPKVPQQLSLNI